MIEYKPTRANIEKAKKLAREMGILYGSFTFGTGNTTGMLGEIACMALLKKAKLVSKTSRTHDIELAGVTIDVKSKRCKGPPLPYYTASVVQKKNLLKADVLLFTRVHENLKTVWILGWLPTKEFYKKATLIEAGTREGPFLHRVSGFHIDISELRPFESLQSVTAPLSC